MALLDSDILIGVLLLLVILSITWIIRLEFRLQKLTKGTDKKSLETSIHKIQAHVEDFDSFKNSTITHLKDVERRLNQSIQNVATIRFDPFKGAGHGGSQSFATAFLDEGGDGVVISTITTRERVGVFSKPLKNGTSEYELTPEELSVIAAAMGNKDVNEE